MSWFRGMLWKVFMIEGFVNNGSEAVECLLRQQSWLVTASCIDALGRRMRI